MKTIAIIGSREYPKPDAVREFVNTLDSDTVIVTGGWWKKAPHDGDVRPTRGVDMLAAQAAKDRGMTVVCVAADYDYWHNQAGIRRNPVIIEIGQEVVAFWNKKSPGTKHGIKYAVKIKRPIRIFGPEGKEEKVWTQESLL